MMFGKKRTVKKDDISAAALCREENVSGRPFSMQLLLAAGPRKTANATIELGEDAGGFIDVHPLTFFWLADGTSDCLTIPGFSSRVLAQTCGLAVEYVALETHKEAANSRDPEHILGRVIDRLLADVTLQLCGWWQHADNSARQAAKQQFAETADAAKRTCVWSTTLIFGFINRLTAETMLWQLGDCAAVFFKKSERLVEVAPRRGRLFVRLTVSDDSSDPIVDLSRPDVIEKTSVEDVTSFALFTDGNTSEPSLISTIGLGGFDLLASHLRSNQSPTGDDKGVLLGQFLDT